MKEPDGTVLKAQGGCSYFYFFPDLNESTPKIMWWIYPSETSDCRAWNVIRVRENGWCLLFAWGRLSDQNHMRCRNRGNEMRVKMGARWWRYLTPDISWSLCECECAEAIIIALLWAHYWSKSEKIGDEDDVDDANDDDIVDHFRTCLSKAAFSLISKGSETHCNSLQHCSVVVSSTRSTIGVTILWLHLIWSSNRIIQVGDFKIHIQLCIELLIRLGGAAVWNRFGQIGGFKGWLNVFAPAISPNRRTNPETADRIGSVIQAAKSRAL